MQPQTETSDLEKMNIDLIVVGNSNSGKTSLIKRFIKGEKSFMHSYQPSIGISLEKKQMVIDNHHVSIKIWDTAGQQKFFALAKNYFRKADGILIIFDLTDKNSFDRINSFWMHQIRDNAPKDCSQVIIGNKVDLINERLVAFETGNALANSLHINYFQTSAKTGNNIEEALEYIIRDCIKKVDTSEATGVHLGDSQQLERQKSCFHSPKQFFHKLLWKKQEQNV